MPTYSVQDKDDIQYVVQALQTCRQRHLDLDERTVTRLLETLGRHGGVEEAVLMLEQSEKFRLFPKSAAYSRVMKYAALSGEVELMRRVEKAMTARGLHVPSQAVYSYVR